jgi:hypothetical protein
MLRRSIIVGATLLVGALLLASSGSAQKAVESPLLPKVFCSLSSGPDFGSVFKLGTKVEYEVGCGNSRASGLPGFRARVFVPGMKILILHPVQLDSSVKSSWKLASGGAVATFGHVPANTGYTFAFLARARGPVGVSLADKVVLTLPNGKSATYKLDSYKVNQ